MVLKTSDNICAPDAGRQSDKDSQEVKELGCFMTCGNHHYRTIERVPGYAEKQDVTVCRVCCESRMTIGGQLVTAGMHH